MPAVVFIVDTAHTMATQDFVTSPNLLRPPTLTRLDGAKACVESYLRQNGGRRANREYLLVEAAAAGPRVVVGWGSEPGRVEAEVKLLRPSAPPPPGPSETSPPPTASLNGALSLAFQLLSQFRLARGADQLLS